VAYLLFCHLPGAVALYFLFRLDCWRNDGWTNGKRIATIAVSTIGGAPFLAASICVSLFDLLWPRFQKWLEKEAKW
jgi:hypothetical protein